MMDSLSNRLRVALTVALSSLALTTCATNPATGERQLILIGEGREIEIGRAGAKSVEASIGLYADDDLQEYVNEVGQRLAATTERPDLPWSFKVVDDPVVNAFALPGGFIYFTRGIMSHFNSEAELAAVLGHEIGHVTARHSVEQISRAQVAQLGLGVGSILLPEVQEFGDLLGAGLGILFLKFSRDDESQADRLGLRYMTRQRYEPTEMADVFTMLGRVSESAGGGLPTWLSTHPAPEDRRERILELIAESPAPRTGTVGRDRYLEKIDGMVFGRNPRNGFFQDQLFLHPDLEFRFQFPAGWKTRNTAQAVVGVSEREDAIIQLGFGEGSSAEEAARNFFSQSGIQRGRTWRRAVNGHPATWGSFEARTEQSALAGLATFIEYGGRVYQILGYTAAGRLGAYESVFERSLGSFDRLTDPAALAVQPSRIELVRLNRSMTLRDFDRENPSTIPLGTLAIINGVLDEDETLSAGRTLKRVGGGELPGNR